MFVLDMFQGMIMVTMRLMTEKMMEYNLSWFNVVIIQFDAANTVSLSVSLHMLMMLWKKRREAGGAD